MQRSLDSACECIVAYSRKLPRVGVISLPGSGAPDPGPRASLALELGSPDRGIGAAPGAKAIPGVSSSLPPRGTLPLQKCLFKTPRFCAEPQEARVPSEA